MIKEYWIDTGYYRNGAWCSYEAEETYTTYKEALREYSFHKKNLSDNEYVELWIVDWDDDEGMVNQHIRFRSEKRGDK